MPFLDWVGKKYVLNYDQEVPFHLLKKDLKKSKNSGENILIEGDNLIGLKSLFPKFKNKIKCIFIDPPYNTGSEKWVYNDNVNSPLMKKWLEEGVVGKEDEDLNRHDKWLCMMYPRLKMLHELLRDDGIIFVHIDDNEVFNLKSIMDEIFHGNFITAFHIQVRYSAKTLAADSEIQKLVETVLIYSKSAGTKLIFRKTDYSLDKFFWKIKETGKHTTVELGGKKVDIFKKGNYEIIKDSPSKTNLKEIWATGTIAGYGGSSGEFSQKYLVTRKDIDGLETLYKVHGIGDDIYEHRYFTGPKKASATKGKYYQGVPKAIFESLDSHMKSLPIDNFEDFADKFGNCRLEGGVDFPNGKKPIAYLEHLIRLALPDNEDNYILDSFAGSGSTAHAVLELNKKRKQNNKFILVELEKDICQKTTVKCLSNIYDEYGGDSNPENEFQYYTIGEELKDKDDKLNPSITFENLAECVYFNETKTNFDPKMISGNLIGDRNGTPIYLLFKNGKNLLNLKFLNSLDKAQNKTIYAEKCLVSEDDLKEHNAVFKQIPYDIRSF